MSRILLWTARHNVLLPNCFIVFWLDVFISIIWRAKWQDLKTKQFNLLCLRIVSWGFSLPNVSCRATVYESENTLCSWSWKHFDQFFPHRKIRREIDFIRLPRSIAVLIWISNDSQSMIKIPHGEELTLTQIITLFVALIVMCELRNRRRCTKQLNKILHKLP